MNRAAELWRWMWSHEAIHIKGGVCEYRRARSAIKKKNVNLLSFQNLQNITSRLRLLIEL